MQRVKDNATNGVRINVNALLTGWRSVFVLDFIRVGALTFLRDSFGVQPAIVLLQPEGMLGWPESMLL